MTRPSIRGKSSIQFTWTAQQGYSRSDSATPPRGKSSTYRDRRVLILRSKTAETVGDRSEEKTHSRQVVDLPRFGVAEPERKELLIVAAGLRDLPPLFNGNWAQGGFGHGYATPTCGKSSTYRRWASFSSAVSDRSWSMTFSKRSSQCQLSRAHLPSDSCSKNERWTNGNLLAFQPNRLAQDFDECS